ncbi:Dynein light chain 1 cytoplasmic [Taenia solium]|eukprot:TsM_000664500 transcript=TsM_000664500 gene=TsM_000664500
MELEDALDLIEKVDVDCNGYITRAELVKHLNETNQDLAIVDNWFKWFDLDNKGVIEAEDVCTTLGVSLRESYAQRVKANRERRGKKTSIVSDTRSKRLIDKISDSSGNSSMSSSRSSKVKEEMDRRHGFTTSSSSSEAKDGRATKASRDRLVDSQKSLSDRSLQNEGIKEVIAPVDASAPQVSGRKYNDIPSVKFSSSSSCNSLRDSFEILHEEAVDDDLLKDVMEIVKNNEDKVKEEKDMAKLLKDGVEKRHGKHWQAIVAYTNLGCNVEHEVKTFVYLRKNNRIYILFRTPIAE